MARPAPSPLPAGCHTLRLGCTLWVYNLTGIPISLRQSIDEALVLRSAELKEEQEEDVVSGWGCIGLFGL